jgi:putative NADH-flavin reductase
MKCVVFGATGGVGRQLVQQALITGHEVTAFQHHMQVSSDHQEMLHIVRGDLFDLSSVKVAIQGQDVVLAAYGAHGRKNVAVYPEGMGNILFAMNELGIKRLICITSAAVDDDPALGFFFGKIIKPLFLKDVYQALKQIELRVEQSSLDWTIVGPGKLTDGPHTGVYRISEQGIPNGGTKIARADVADLMLKEATNSQYIHKKLVVVY